MSKRKPVAHRVLLAANEADAAAAMRRDPSIGSYSVITAESQLYGLWITDWAITERAAANMADLGKMIRYLRARESMTRGMLN